MRAFAFTGSEAQLVEVSEPTLQADDDVIVRVELASVCRSDLNIVDGLERRVPAGRILGHEAVGTVVAAGMDVLIPHVGARVLLQAIWSCGACASCLAGTPVRCRVGTWQVGRDADGAHAEFVRVPNAIANTVVVPDVVDPIDALFLSDVFATARELAADHIRVGDYVLVLGSGPVGLAVGMLAKDAAAGTVVVIGRSAERAAHARRLGLIDTLDLELTDAGAAARDPLLVGADVVVDTIGTPASFRTGLDALAGGGTLCNIAAHRCAVSVPMDQVWSRDLVIRTGLVRGSSTRGLMHRTRDGLLAGGQLATDRFAFTDIAHAYAATRAGGQVVKVVVDVAG